jgi:hypothetical protein
MNIVQVGCHKGKDHVQEFIEINYNSITRVLLIDANEECIKVCQNSYNHLPKIEFFNFAVVPGDEEFVEFYIPTSSLNIEQGSTLKSFVEAAKIEYKTVKTPAKNLNTFLKEQNLFQIERLYIDAEALDIDIVNSIDFNTFNIPYLYFEKLHSDGRQNSDGPRYQNCIQQLQAFGYNKIEERGWDILATK